MTLNIDQFLMTLPVMLKGMCGIFIVTAVIILMIVALNYLTVRKEDGKKG